MSYLTQDAIAGNSAMNRRVAQAAASEDLPDNPDAWAGANRRYWAAAPGWDTAWESALVAHPDDPAYDPGADESVITDPMILSQIQSMIRATTTREGQIR